MFRLAYIAAAAADSSSPVVLTTQLRWRNNGQLQVFGLWYFARNGSRDARSDLPQVRRLMRASLDLRTGPETTAIAAALRPEVEAGIPKVALEMSSAGERLRFEMEADDIVSLRAALNSFLGWAACAQQVAKNGD